MILTSRVKQALKISLVAIATMALTGCWDRLEIENRAVILGIAIDLEETDKDEPEGISAIDEKHTPTVKQRVRITAQVAVPGRIPLGPGEGGGSGSEKPVWAVSATGRTLDGAIMALQQELADRIFFGHLRVVVISEQYARNGIENLNDFFKRNPQIRRLTWIAVSKGPAEAIMQAKPELERVPALYLLAMLDHSVDLGKYPYEHAGKFWSKDSSDGQDPNLPYIELKENDKIMIAGMAMFRDERLAGITSTPIEIGFYMAITNTKQGGYSAYTSIPGVNDYVMFHASSRRSVTDVQIKNGRPQFNIRIQIEGDLREQTKNIDLEPNDQIIDQVERQLEHTAAEAMHKFVARTQALGTDIFGFGEYVRAKEHAYWLTYAKTKEGWRKIYKDIDVNITVDIKIRRIGMREI